MIIVYAGFYYNELCFSKIPFSYFLTDRLLTQVQTYKNMNEELSVEIRKLKKSVNIYAKVLVPKWKIYEKESKKEIENLNSQIEQKDEKINDLAKANEELESNFEEQVNSKAQEIASTEIENKASIIRESSIKELSDFLLNQANFYSVYCFRDGMFRCKFSRPDVIGKTHLSNLLADFQTKGKQIGR